MERPNETSPQETMPPRGASLNEQCEYFDRHPEDIRPADLNNLHLWLPGSGYLKMIDRMLDRKRSPEPHDSMHSELWLSQTARDSVRVIEETISELSEEERTKLNGLWEVVNHLQDTRKPFDHLMPELHAALVPVYLALRKKGYSHYDVVV